MRIYRLSAAAILLSALWPSTASAVPDATYSKQVGTPSSTGAPQGQSSTSASTLAGFIFPSPGPGLPPGSVPNLPSIAATASSSVGPTPSVSALVGANGAPGAVPAAGALAAQSAMRYYFSIVGTPGTDVPIQFEGITRTSVNSGNGLGGAKASLISYDQRGTSALLVDRYCSNGPFPGVGAGTNLCSLSASSFSVGGRFQSVASGTDFSGYLDLIAYAGFIGTSSSLFNVQAFIDPVISIDPTFLASNPGFSIVVSQGLGNGEIAAAVPEPAAWVMMLAGFGAIGGAMRRMREAGGPATA